MKDVQGTLDRRDYAQVGIIGFGAVGQAVLTQQVRYLQCLIEKDPETIPLVEFNICNEGDDHAFGQAYDLTCMVNVLNFPVQTASDRFNVPAGTDLETVKLSGMHLLEEDDLVGYLAQRRAAISPEEARHVATEYRKLEQSGASDLTIAHTNPALYRDYMLSRNDGHAWGVNSYLPRAFYREYLLHCFNRTQQAVAAINARAGFEAVKLNAPRDCTVVRMEMDHEEGFCVDAAEAQQAEACTILGGSSTCPPLDGVVIATGHHRASLFGEEITTQPSFANTPLDDTEIEKAIGSCNHPDGHVLIVGTGNSYLDALRNLYALGYQGKITAISSRPVDYWPYDPAKNSCPYDGSSFIAAVAGQSFDEMKQALLTEVHSAAGIEAGPQNIFDSLEARWNEIGASVAPEELERFAAFFDDYRTKRTSPSSYAVFRSFKDSGQLSFIPSRLQTVSFSQEAQRWQVVLQDGQELSSDALVDCASLVGRVIGRGGYIADPLLRSIVEEGGLACADQDTGLVVPTQTCHERLAFAGPAGTNDRGIPYTRQLFARASVPVLMTALERAERRRAAVEEPAVSLP